MAESMEEMIARFGEQLRWSTTVSLPAMSADRVLVCGMGGSGIAGDFVRRLAVGEVEVHKDFGVPGWAATERPSVVVSSYSGNTEEALSSYADARAAALDVVVITTGGELSERAASDRVPVVPLLPGYQPRAAFGMAFGTLARLVTSAGLAGIDDRRLRAAADHVDRVIEDAGADVRRVLEHVGEGRPHVMAVEPYMPVAYRWKTQWNENAKRFASASALPELAHNELVPLAGGDAPPLVFLRDGLEPPALRRRIEVMAAMVPLLEVTAAGDGMLQRMLGLTVIGDLASTAAARAAGVDPVAVSALQDFKRKVRGA